MYQTCPKCQYQRQPHDRGDSDSCPACGIVFSKWLKAQLASKDSGQTPRRTGSTDARKPGAAVAGFLFHVEERVNPVYFWGRCLLFAGLCLWTWKFLQMDFVMNPFQIGRSFMHNIDLIFHEAGHIIFMPFGRFMTILGGSLMQVLVPLAVMLAFLVKNREPFAASVGLWWAGQSLMDLAPYIDDAIDQKLILLGGRTGADAPGNHDWGNIFIELGMLERHREVAHWADNGGALLMLLACSWGAYMLARQYRKLS